MSLPAFFTYPGIPRFWHISSIRIAQLRVNLETAVEREKAVEDIYVHREFKKLVVTFWVMRDFLNFLGA